MHKPGDSPDTSNSAAPRPASPARRRFLRTAALGALALSGTALYAGEAEPEHLEVVQRDVKLTDWPVSAAGLRVGQLSDLHCQSDRAVARTQRAVRLLLDQKPDIVFLTGDFVSSSSHYVLACMEALGAVTSVPRGVFAVLGNHDWGGRHPGQRPAYVTRELERIGISVLRNRSVQLPGNPGVWLVGLDPRSMGAHDPERALRHVPQNAVKLLLVHEPDFADEAPPGFALQFSGHSHGGQIRLPGLPPLHCPNYGQHYPEGLQQAKNHPVYTTRGIGMIGPQMRFCCPPEVTVLTLYPA